MHLFLKNLNFEFWVSKSKNIKNPRSPDCSALNFTSFGVYGLCFTSNVHILEACKHLPLFDPKSWNMTSLKHNFLKHFSTDISEILSDDVKLMPKKVLRVPSRYLLSFLSYLENMGGDNIYPPPSTALVKVCNFLKCFRLWLGPQIVFYLRPLWGLGH